ncbi:uncharacterized protein LOC143300075 [Babylonia areolata]|uniref:uncharacterized protein LOC143300075 n=1 Tax=Babylonia areolata TaxID=304850 RepID=UPI003FD44219
MGSETGADLPPKAGMSRDHRNACFSCWLAVRERLRAAGWRVRQACQQLGEQCVGAVGRQNVDHIQASAGTVVWNNMAYLSDQVDLEDVEAQEKDEVEVAADDEKSAPSEEATTADPPVRETGASEEAVSPEPEAGSYMCTLT